MSHDLTRFTRAALLVGATTAAITVGLAGKAHAAGAPRSATASTSSSVTLDFRTNDTAPATVTVGSFDYRLTHESYGAGYKGASTSLVIDAHAGVTGTLRGSYRYEGESTTHSVDQTVAPEGTVTVFAPFNTAEPVVAHADGLRLTGSDGSVQVISVTITADDRMTSGPYRFMVQGTVTR